MLGNSAARADDDKKLLPFPIGLRVRHALPKDANAYEVGSAAFVLGTADGKSASVDMVAAIGSSAGRTSGTFAYSFTYGVLLGRQAPADGMTLRVGADILVDSMAHLRATELSLPVAQVGYFHGRPAIDLDAGVEASPVLAGRMRQDDAARYMGVGAKAGAYAGAMLAFGMTARVSANHLLVSQAPGGGSDWAQALLCYGIGWIDLCADGFAARFTPPSARPVLMGYAGGTLGLGMGKLSGFFGPPST
jgi:hypothetical protein